jgi:hypothetical protein
MALKGRMGDMRREIRKCVGQLIHGPPSANRSQVRHSVTRTSGLIFFAPRRCWICTP